MASSYPRIRICKAKISGTRSMSLDQDLKSESGHKYECQLRFGSQVSKKLKNEDCSTVVKIN